MLLVCKLQLCSMQHTKRVLQPTLPHGQKTETVKVYHVVILVPPLSSYIILAMVAIVYVGILELQPSSVTCAALVLTLVYITMMTVDLQQPI